MLAYLMMKSLLMPACPQTHHPSLCPRHTMPVTSGCKTLSISASEELRWGRGGHVPKKKAQKHPSASTQTIVLAFPHTTSLHRRAKPGPFRGTTANPLSPVLGWPALGQAPGLQPLPRAVDLHFSHSLCAPQLGQPSGWQWDPKHLALPSASLELG